MALDLTLGYLAVDVASTTGTVTTVAHKFFPFLLKNPDGTPYPKTGRQQYDADPLANSKLIDLVLPEGKQLEEIVPTGPVQAKLYAREVPTHDGGYSFFADAPVGLSLRTRLTQQNVSSPLTQTKPMTADVGGYANPDLYTNSVPYASLHTGLVTGDYLAELLGANDVMLTSKNVTATVTTGTTTNGGGNPPPPPPAGGDTSAEGYSAGALDTPESLNDYDGQAAANQQAQFPTT